MIAICYVSHSPDSAIVWAHNGKYILKGDSIDVKNRNSENVCHLSSVCDCDESAAFALRAADVTICMRGVGTPS